MPISASKWTHDQPISLPSNDVVMKQPNNPVTNSCLLVLVLFKPRKMLYKYQKRCMDCRTMGYSELQYERRLIEAALRQTQKCSTKADLIMQHKGRINIAARGQSKKHCLA